MRCTTSADTKIKIYIRPTRNVRDGKTTDDKCTAARVKQFDSDAGRPNCGNQEGLSKQKEAQGGFACLFWPSKRAPPPFFSLAGLYVCRWEVLINKNSSARVARFIAAERFLFLARHAFHHRG